MNLEELLKSTESQHLSEIETQRKVLEERLQTDSFVTPEIEQAYQLALARLGEDALKLATDPRLQRGYADIGIEAVTGLEQLEPLREILPAEQLEPIRDQLLGKKAASLSFFERYGAHTPEAQEFIKRTGAELAVAETVEVEPVADMPTTPTPGTTDVDVGPPQPEALAQKTPVTLTVRGGTVKVGRNGRIIPLSKKHTAKQADYSEERLEALKILIKNQGTELSPHEIWENMFDDNRPFEKETMTQIRKWLINLSYGRRPLIAVNGKRGTASRYGVSEIFELDLISEESLAKPETSAEMLKKSDLYIAAANLARFGSILANNGIPALDPKIEKGLHQFSPDFSHIRGDASAIRKSRQEALDRVLEFLNDEDRFYKYLESADAEGPGYEFIQYMLDLEEDQKNLLKRIIACSVESIPREGGGYDIFAVNSNGDVVATGTITNRPPAPLDVLEENDVVCAPTPEPAETAVGAGDSEDEGAASGDSDTNDVIRQKEQTARPKKELTATEKAKLEDIRSQVEAIASIYIQSGLTADKRYKRKEVQGVLPKFTTKVVKEAEEARIIRNTGSHRTFDITDTVNVLIFNNGNLQNTYRTRKFRRHIAEIIEQGIQKAQEAHRLTESRI